MPIRVGIMGFGRIGRNLFRLLYHEDEIEVVVISDIASPDGLVYLLNWDTIHGKFIEECTFLDGNLYANGRQIPMLGAREPGDVAWKDFDVDIVIEATGKFRYREQLEKHLEAGAPRVVLTNPPRDMIDNVVIFGVNDDTLSSDDKIVSCGSCTANCLGPIVKVLDDAVGIEKGFMTTVHAYTNDQRLADVPHTELRRSRAAAENIIPTTTWSYKAVQKLLPNLEDRLEGIAMNVPVPDGSAVDLVTLMKRDVTVEEIDEIVRSASRSTMKGVMEFCDDPIVSSDVVGNPHSCIYDQLSTRVLGGNMVKTLCWYDNGWGYANRVVELIYRLAKLADEEAV